MGFGETPIGLTRKAAEYLGQRHGLIGQETTGVGGMAKALREPLLHFVVLGALDRGFMVVETRSLGGRIQVCLGFHSSLPFHSS